MRRAAQAALVERVFHVVDARLAALLPPEEIVFGEDAPTAARLGGPGQIARAEEGEHVQRQLFGQEGDEVALELRLDHGHHVPHLGRLAQLDQLVDRAQALGVRPQLRINSFR